MAGRSERLDGTIATIPSLRVANPKAGGPGEVIWLPRSRRFRDGLRSLYRDGMTEPAMFQLPESPSDILWMRILGSEPTERIAEPVLGGRSASRGRRGWARESGAAALGRGHIRAVKRARALVAATALVAGRAAAAEPPLPVRYDLSTDIPVAAAAVASAVALAVLKPELTPLGCRVCGPDRLDDAVHDALLWRNQGTADTLSSVLANVAIPAGMLGYGFASASLAGDPGAGAVDALLVVEAGSLATVLESGVKYATARLRPYAWYDHLPPHPGAYDRNLSFYSGHTSFAFATATSAGTIFMMRDYPEAPVVLGVGLAAATGVGYLRIAAGEHYLTDVLAGAAAGGLVGFAVPWFFHRFRGGAPQPGDLLPAPGGIAIAW